MKSPCNGLVNACNGLVNLDGHKDHMIHFRVTFFPELENRFWDRIWTALGEAHRVVTLVVHLKFIFDFENAKKWFFTRILQEFLTGWSFFWKYVIILATSIRRTTRDRFWTAHKACFRLASSWSASEHGNIFKKNKEIILDLCQKITKMLLNSARMPPQAI